MRTETSTPPEEAHDDASPVRPSLFRSITRSEIIVAALVAGVMLVLVLIEPNILEAPFQNERTLLFTVGGTVIAALAYVAMLRLRVHPVIRVIVLIVPFVIVNYGLISPYFVDDVVDEDFTTSISEQVAPLPTAPVTTGTRTGEEVPVQEQPPAAPEPAAPEAEQAPPPPAPSAGPVLLGAGRFVGLAGHSGTGDAGIFRNADGSLVLRFENFDIENGPDLEVYLVPGPDQTSLPDGSIALGALEGNIGDQNYELPAGTELAPGPYTALVWCEAFSVEFVGATIVI
jgi:hypothetical protein